MARPRSLVDATAADRPLSSPNNSYRPRPRSDLLASLRSRNSRIVVRERSRMYLEPKDPGSASVRCARAERSEQASQDRRDVAGDPLRTPPRLVDGV
jgi:hypothetical protein